MPPAPTSASTRYLPSSTHPSAGSGSSKAAVSVGHCSISSPNRVEHVGHCRMNTPFAAKNTNRQDAKISREYQKCTLTMANLARREAGRLILLCILRELND